VAALLAAGGPDDVAYVGAPDSLEERLAADAGIRFLAVRASGWDRARPLTLLTAVATTVTSLFRCVSLLRSERTDVVVGFGGYVSFPLGLAAGLAGVPLVVQEQNSIPGLANRVLARWARRVCVTYEESVAHLPHRDRVVVTGNPVRTSVLSADAGEERAALGLGESDTLLLVFGGSRGARHLNDAIVKLYSRLSLLPGLRVVQVAGPLEQETVSRDLARQAGGEAPVWWTVAGYVENMGELMAASDLVVCRAGATTLAEVSALGKPSVLVPYPYATDDHQTRNAEPFVAAGAAVAFADARLDEPEFGSALISLLRDPPARAAMAAKAAALGRPHAAEAVFDAVRSAAGAVIRPSGMHDEHDTRREGRN
jgi:UDP-N-acetylglucosamine--N-acetylmuramyl-(pentapeptide) pyrophosphoryl-undecaprenol N-acetylglucosamine transferase